MTTHIKTEQTPSATADKTRNLTAEAAPETAAERDKLREALETAKRNYTGLVQSYERVLKQRDELLAACKEAVAIMQRNGVGYGETQLRAAIAKAEGKQ